jgi:hypothetical protein
MGMKPVLLVALLLATPQTAAGRVEDIKKDLAACAALDIETARLDCFERLTRAVTQIAFKPPEPRASKSEGSARDIRTISPAETANHVGEEVVVEGQVSQVGASERSHTLFVNFGGYPNHVFTAVIFSKNLPSFSDARSWEGKTIRVRGKVQVYRGKPEIVLERREQVEELK